MSALPSETGISLWEQRRRQWLSPSVSSDRTSSAPVAPPQPHAGRARLEEMLSVDGAEEDEGVWRTVQGVWSRLTRGQRLNTTLALSLVVKILRAGWIRDGTWPRSADGGAPASAGMSSGNGGNGHNSWDEGNPGGAVDAIEGPIERPPLATMTSATTEYPESLGTGEEVSEE